MNEHGLTTIGRKLDKVKAIQCHYYRQIKESVNTDKSCGAKDESDGTGYQGIKNMRKNSTVRRKRATMTLFSTICMRQFSSYQMTKYVKLLFKVHETLSINIDVTCLHIVTLSLAFCGSWDRREGIKTTLYALRGDHVSAPLSQQKSLAHPSPIQGYKKWSVPWQYITVDKCYFQAVEHTSYLPPFYIYICREQSNPHNWGLLAGLDGKNKN